MTAQVELVRMRWWHIEEILPLESDLFTEQQWSARAFWNELAQIDSRHYVVAVVHENASARNGSPRETVVGYAGLCRYADEAHVLTIGVRRESQRQGIGSLLLADLLADADQHSIPRVLLEVREDHAVAQRLYARHGFMPIGMRRHYYQPSGAHAVVMARDGR